MRRLAAMVTSTVHGGCQVVMVSSGEMTLVWPDTGTADHGWSHHNYFINTHTLEMLGRVESTAHTARAINGQSFIFR